MNKSVHKQTPAEIDEQIETIGHKQNHQLAILDRLKKQSDSDERTTQIQNAEAALADLDKKLSPLKREYDRRGGWNRVYIVMGGRIHATTSCRNGYFATTDWRWVPSQSGRDWNEIMSDAGDRMCTWCFPHDSNGHRRNKSKIQHPEEGEKERRKAEREAAKARKEAEVKRVHDPATGEQIRDRDNSIIKTERSVQTEAADALEWSLIRTKWADEVTSDPEWQQYETTAELERRAARYRQSADKDDEEARRLIHALAAKRGVDEGKLYEEMLKKARKKR